jgi:hypothetical protein
MCASETGERRRYSRFEFDSLTLLRGPEGEREAQLVDLSLKGVLLRVGADWQPVPEALYEIALVLSPAVAILMQAEPVHRRDEVAGFVCTRIDLDSLAHLRRLAELNLGDAALLERELQELLVPRR